MALPTPEKTWQFAHVINTPSGSLQGDIRQIVWGIKDALINFGSSPWTVAGSSDGATAGMDAVDRWVTDAVITFNGGAGPTAWIVLEQAGWGGGQILINCSNDGSFGSAARTKFSLTGTFAGGSTVNLPSAADEFDYNFDLCDLTTLTFGGQLASHVMMSDDGENTRVVNCSKGYASSFWIMETPGLTGADWTIPRAFGRSPTLQLTNGVLHTAGTIWMRGQQAPIGHFPIFSLFDEFDLTRIYDKLAVPNEISGEYPLFDVGMFNPTTVGARGRLGHLVDVWFSINSVVAGDYFPDDGSKQFIAFGSSPILPWDGTTAVLG